MQRIEPLERLHPLDQSFRVVEAIDADHQRPIAEALHDVADETRFHRALRQALKFLGLDAHGEAADAGLPPARGKHELPVGRLEHPAVGDALLGHQIAREIADVGFRLQSHQIVLQQQRQQPLVVGQNGDDFRRGEGDMQEEADAVGETALAKLLRDRDQVIVVDPDEVVGLEDLRQLGGEMLVHPEIAGQVAAIELGQVDAIMQHRPQHAVGEAVVIFLVVLLGEIGHHERALLALDRARPDLARGHDLAAPAEPDALHFIHRRRERDFEAAGALAGARPRKRHPVRNEDQPRQYRSSQLRDSRMAVRISPAIE